MLYELLYELRLRILAKKVQYNVKASWNYILVLAGEFNLLSDASLEASGLKSLKKKSISNLFDIWTICIPILKQ